MDAGINRAAYNAVAQRWDDNRREFYGRERAYLDAFLDGLDASVSILDLGCGTGRPMGAYVLARGHRLTGVDQSAAMLRIATTHLPGARLVEAQPETYDIDNRYAGVMCWDTLFHIERRHHEGILRKIHACLDAGGRLMLTLGGHPPFVDTMFDETFYYDSHPPEVMSDLLDAIGFDVLIGEFMNRPTSGRDKGRYAIVACKR